MSSQDEEQEKKQMIKLIGDIVTSSDKKIDDKKLKTVKKRCKNSDSALATVNAELFSQLKKNNSDIRLLCLAVFDELFTRSHLFRNLTIEKFEELTILCTGVDSLKPLPLPKQSAKQLQSKSIQTFKSWIDSYMEGYPKLKIVYEALKRRVNFSSATLLNDVDEMRREAEREREATLWRGRVLQVDKEVTDNQDAMDQCIQESRNCIELWQTGGQPGLEDVRTANLCDQYNLLYKRHIPLCKTWTVTLSKAGRHTNHELFRKCVEMKRSLDAIFEEIIKLGIDFEKLNSSRSVVEDVPKRKKGEEELFSDPTTLAANVKKYNKLSEFPAKSDFLADSNPKPSTSKDFRSSIESNISLPSTSKSSEQSKEIKSEMNENVKNIKLENVPVIKLSELVSEYTVERDMDLETVWLNGERPQDTGLKPSAPTIKRVITLSGEFEPVTRSCRYPLENGTLCPRKDRVKCPFHGLIINRDDQGNPVTALLEVNKTQQPSELANQKETPPLNPPTASPAKKKKIRQSRKLLSEAKAQDTSRARLEKRVFNKAAVKRVARTLDAQDKKRAKSMFSEQFNYSIAPRRKGHNAGLNKKFYYQDEVEVQPRTKKSISDPDFYSNISKGFSEALVTGKFCDVKIICQDSNLWAHRVVLGTVSPFLRNLLMEMERRGDDVITIFLPRIKGYHMKLVLDYIYSGAMYLCGAHMQYVIQVMEVLNLKCGVSVNKMVQSTSADQEWIEVEHSTVKIQSNFTAPQKSGKLSGKKSGVRKSSTDTPTHSRKVEEKRKSEEKVSPRNEEEAKLADKSPNYETPETVDSNESTTISTPTETEIESSPNIPLASVANDTPTATNEMNVDTTNDPDPKDGNKSLENTPEKGVNNENDNVETADNEANRNDTQENNEKSSDDKVVENAGNEKTEDIIDIPAVADGSSDEEADFEKEKDEKGTEKQGEQNANAEEPNDDHGAVDDNDGLSDDDEPIFVEIDEHFAVDSLTSSQAELNDGRKHKCALCGRMFRFYLNLRVHLTGHLGVKVTLSRCHACKRNFKNQTELDLHMKAHSYARHLGKYRLARKAAEDAKSAAAATAAITDAKIITTVGTRDKKILRKYTKNSRGSNALLTRNKKSANKDEVVKEKETTKQQKIKSVPKLTLSIPRTPPLNNGGDVKTPTAAKPAGGGKNGPTSGQQFSCEICDKSFIVRSLYRRHMKHKHGVEPQIEERDETTPSAFVARKILKNKKRHSIASIPAAGSVSAATTPSYTSMPSPSAAFSAAAGKRENPYSRQYSTPTSSRKREHSSASESSDFPSSPLLPAVAKRRKVLLDTSADPTEKSAQPRSGGAGSSNLKCSDCDRMFVAQTILERHQYTAKHGVYGTSSDSGPGSPSIQHVTERQVDCHLCGQVFLRVKDLVKHREKVCTAWLNPGT